MNNVIIRLPRPLGMTQAMAQYQTTKDPELFNNIQGFFIQQWLINNQFICGRLFSVLELSNFLHCDPERIRLQMRDQLLNTKLWDKDKQEELINAMMGQQISWALEDRMAVEGQVRLLQNSQGNKYTPFVTSEVNKAMAMKLQTTANLNGILKSLQGVGSINIFNQQQQNNIEVGITMEQAVQIIGDENAKMIGQDKEIQYIEAHYDTENFPQVVANEQQGIDTHKEALAISSGDLEKITDNYKGVLSEFDKDHHEMRREIELNIDDEEEDPEMTIYPQ